MVRRDVAAAGVCVALVFFVARFTGRETKQAMLVDNPVEVYSTKLEVKSEAEYFDVEDKVGKAVRSVNVRP